MNIFVFCSSKRWYTGGLFCELRKYLDKKTKNEVLKKRRLRLQRIKYAYIVE